MANCSICGKKIGFLSGKVCVSDGVICGSCWTKAGLDTRFTTMMQATKKTVNQLRDLIDLQILQEEAKK